MPQDRFAVVSRSGIRGSRGIAGAEVGIISGAMIEATRRWKLRQYHTE